MSVIANIASNKNDEAIINSEFWTTECNIDELSCDLAKVRIEVTVLDYMGVRKTIHYRKYYFQGRYLMKWIPIAIPVPPFVINISDLSLGVQQHLEYEYKNNDEDVFNYILTQSAGRILENINFKRYHRCVAKKLVVMLKK